MDFMVKNTLDREVHAVIRILPAGEPLCFAETHLQEAYQAFYADDSVSLSHLQILPLRLRVHGAYTPVLAAGFDCGKCGDYPMDHWRKLIRKIGTELIKLQDHDGEEPDGSTEKQEENRICTKEVFLDRLPALPFAEDAALLKQIAAVLPLCEYSFTAHKTKAKTRLIHQVSVLCGGSQAEREALSEGSVLAESVSLARDLVNEDAAVLTPARLASVSEELGRQYGFSVEILEKEDCEKLGMGLFLGVSSGSALPPKFIIMRWKGGAPETPPAALVGKGITYDTGGLAIKTGSMELMRFDMNGAAAVIGAMCAIARRSLPCNVVGVVAACENAVDALSYRNGDILTSMNGKTVFVQNTDAEGRLSMADAITWCVRNEHPSMLVEVAGLTGSVSSFFGKVCAAASASDPALLERIAALAPVTGEKIAPMPAFPEYEELLESPYADICNAPAGGCGGILAAMFLLSFREDVPMVSIDFGGMPFTRTASDGQPEGATGFGVRTLYELSASVLKKNCWLCPDGK